jgi:RND family efflux transporter MFP subunit
MKVSPKIRFNIQLPYIIMALTLCFSPFIHATEIITVTELQSQTSSILGSSVIPKKQVLLSAQTAGRVISLQGKVGTAFKQGDVIAEIDASGLLAQRAQMMSKISAAQANLYNAKIQYQREMTSPKRDDISAMPGFGVPAMMDQYMTRPMADMMGTNNSSLNKQADLVNIQSHVAQANFALQQAIAQLQQLNASLRDTKTIAPFNGIILTKQVEVGDTLQAGQPLLTFGYIKQLQLSADVPSALVINLKQGTKVAAKIATNPPIQATIAEIHPIADPQRHTIVVKFDLPEGTQASPGMYAEVMLPMSNNNQKGIVTIPASALLKGRSLPSVLVIEGKSSALRLVRLGSKQNNGFLEVLSGLKAGDQIVNHPPAGVTSGWVPQNGQ